MRGLSQGVVTADKSRRQPTGKHSAVRHPERITAMISQNGNAYEEGLSDGWTPIRAYWMPTAVADTRRKWSGSRPMSFSPQQAPRVNRRARAHSFHNLP
jgi:hypothetical protein